MATEFRHQDFAHYLNDCFEVVSEYVVPFDLELIQVSDEIISPKQRIFSILFHGPSDKFLPQRTYRLKHGQLGESEIFLVPVEQDADGFQYQAVFNTLV